MLKNHIIFNTVFILQVIYLCRSIVPQDYGEFTINVNDVEICKGPKRNNCCNITAKLENNTHILFDIRLKKDVALTRGKIEAMMNNKPIIKLKMKKPCDHLFMKPLFPKILNLSQNCVLKKGEYILNTNIQELAEKHYGGVFLYGNLSFKSLFYNDECNFSCVNLEITFSPK